MRHVAATLTPLLSIVTAIALWAGSIARAAEPAPPTDKECAAFGERLAGYLEAGEPEKIVGAMEHFSFMRRTLAGLGVEDDAVRQMAIGFLQGFSKRFAEEYSGVDAVRFVRVERVNGEPRVLLRAVAPSGAVIYSAFYCVRTPAGEVRWHDVFNYAAAEPLTDITRRIILPFLQAEKRSAIERLIERDDVVIKNMAQLQAATQKRQNGDAQGTLDILNKLPPELKKEKFVLLMRLQAGQELDEKLYLEIIDEWEAAFPNDPSRDFIALDGTIMRKDYARALKLLESFNRTIGGDGYLTFLRANVQLMAEDYAAARASARAALEEDPKLLQPWDVLLATALKQEKHAEVAAVLTEFEAKYPRADMKAGIEGEESYAAFRASPEYKAWVEQRAKKVDDKAKP